MSTYKFLTIDQGSTFAEDIYLTANTELTSNLTNCTVISQIREYPESDEVTVQFTGTIVSPSSNGYVILSLTDEETLLLVKRRYVYDVLIENSANQRYRVAEGIIEVSPGVTRTS